MTNPTRPMNLRPMDVLMDANGHFEVRCDDCKAYVATGRKTLDAGWAYAERHRRNFHFEGGN